MLLTTRITSITMQYALMAPNAMESACVFIRLCFTKACRIHVILTKHSKDRYKKKINEVIN